MRDKHVHKYKKPSEGDIFKFCPCGKRKKIYSITKERESLFNKAQALWKKCCHKRDGPGCMVKKKYPYLNLRHTNIMQVDHFFPRGDHNLFFDVSNGTVICSLCNYLRSNGSSQSTAVNVPLQQIIIDREGQQRFAEMWEINDKRSPNLRWKRVDWLKEIITHLEWVFDNIEEGQNEQDKGITEQTNP